MRYTLWVGETFVQTSNELHRLMCSNNQLQAWWVGIEGPDKAMSRTVVTVKDNTFNATVATVEYIPARQLRWKMLALPALQIEVSKTPLLDG